MTILPDEDLPFDATMLDRLAEVSIRVGLNLQPEQDLIISAPVEALPLVRRLAAEAYCNGAGVVTTLLSDDQLTLARFENASDESLDRAPGWMFEAMGAAFNDNTARLAVSAANPLLLAGQDPAFFQQVRRQAIVDRHGNLARLELGHAAAAIAFFAGEGRVEACASGSREDALAGLEGDLVVLAVEDHGERPP